MRFPGEHTLLFHNTTEKGALLTRDHVEEKYKWNLEDVYENDDDWEGGSLDPSSLLNVVGALAKLTGGLPIDPASGAVLS